MKIPAETASFRSTTVCAVREDWMVETEGTELPTPHAVVIEPVSDSESGTEFFDAETGPLRLLRDRSGDFVERVTDSWR